MSDEALLYDRTRFSLPPPALVIFGAIFTVLGIFGCLAVIDANGEDWRRGGLGTISLLAIVSLGGFLIAWGYWRQPVFQFYETHLVVGGSVPNHVEYSRVVLVHLEAVHHSHPYSFPLDEITVAYEDDCEQTQTLRFLVYGSRLRRLRWKQVHDHVSSRIDYSRLAASDPS